MVLEAQWCAMSAGDWFCQKPLTSQSARVAIEPTGLTPPALTMVVPPLVAASGNGSRPSLLTAVLPAGAAPGLVSAGQYVVATALSSSNDEPNFLKELLNGPPRLAMLESGAEAASFRMVQ